MLDVSRVYCRANVETLPSIPWLFPLVFLWSIYRANGRDKELPAHPGLGETDSSPGAATN